MHRTIGKLIGMSIIASTFFSCASYNESVVLGDVIGFSDDIQQSYKNRKRRAPYDISDNQGKEEMDQFILNIPDGQNTVGYYALDVALDRIKYIRKHVTDKDPEIKYYLLLLTDGLDNGSTAAAAQHHHGKYKDTEQYIKKLNKKKTKVTGKDFFKIYPILFTGGDLQKAKEQNTMTDEEFKVFTKNIMEGYRGSSRGITKPEVIVSDDLDDLVKQLEEELSTISEFVFYVPKGYVNKMVCMKIEDVNGTKVSIEGKFIKRGRKYFFKDIQAPEGLVYYSVDKKILQDKNPKKIKAKKSSKKELLSVFTIGDLSYNGKRLILNDSNNSKVEQQIKDFGYYTTNSEYDSQAESRFKTYVIMVIDGSESFQENSELAKQKAIEMRDVITERGNIAIH